MSLEKNQISYVNSKWYYRFIALAWIPIKRCSWQFNNSYLKSDMLCLFLKYFSRILMVFFLFTPLSLSRKCFQNHFQNVWRIWFLFSVKIVWWKMSQWNGNKKKCGKSNYDFFSGEVGGIISSPFFRDS